jgi:toxin-antitoxin system PIN domain toxin
VTALLDVSFLVALFSPRHIHHEVAHSWFADRGWATCSVTVSGAIRVLSNAATGLIAARPDEAARRLRLLCAHEQHEFWSDSVSLLDTKRFDLQFLTGRRQVTDVYLLGLAAKHRGSLVTFDSTIPLRAVKGATEGALVRL